MQTRCVHQIAGPQGLAIDSSGNLFVANGLNSNIIKITPAGHKSVFSAGGAVKDPRALVCDHHDTLYITNTAGSDIFVADPGGKVSSLFGKAPTAWGVQHLWGVAVDKDGALFVTDWDNARVISVGCNDDAEATPAPKVSVAPSKQPTATA